MSCSHSLLGFSRVLGPVLCLCASHVVAAPAEEKPESKIEEIVVVAHPLSAEGLAQASTVLSGAELEKKLGTNIGATLGQEPGIHSASFGNAVGRPVIHGLGGPRVRIMEDRIDALDLSVTSADHAVGVEPFVAERVEVLKGASTLLYGSGAIGGVVDVHTGRIPHSVPDEITGGLETRFDSNTNGNSTAFKVNGGVGQFAWHLDGAWKDGDEYEIPDFTESDRLIALEEAEGEEEEEGEEEVRGEVPGSQFDSESYAAGGSYVGSWGFIGAAVSRIKADYGLPGGHGHEHEEGEGEGEEEEEEEGEGTPLLTMEQVRTDVELGVDNPFGIFSSLNIRFGHNNYEHQEIEPNGEVATDFTNDAWELRGELSYELPNWRGVVGVQHTDREFSAVGEEAFVPPIDSVDTSVFWLSEREFEQFDLELGVRLGRVEHEPSVGRDEEFTTYSLSAGLVVPLADNQRLGILLDRSARAPVGEELYSNGPHLVTGTFELGDPDLEREEATSLAVTWTYDAEPLQLSIGAYYNDFSDFIYEQATGEEEDDLPVFQFQQADAEFYGLDVEVQGTVLSGDWGNLALNAQVDAVRARVNVSGNRNLPRIPPLRYGAGVALEYGAVTATVDYMRNAAQRDSAAQELDTSGFADLRLYLGTEFNLGRQSLGLFLQGRNLLDEEQRLHTSFIKDFAPAPGRTFEVGLRVLFD